MNHYQITRWVDYVRGAVNAAEQLEMSEHLLNCDACRDECNLLARVAVKAQADRRYEVPENALRNARALFALPGKPKKTVLRKVAGYLVFDSFQEPSFAGARSRVQNMRHALYEADDYSVDVRLEHSDSCRVNLVGQLAVRSQAVSSLDGIPVVLMSGRQVLAEALSNEFGEFQLEYEPKRQLKLCVPILERRERIELQLGSLAPKKEID